MDVKCMSCADCSVKNCSTEKGAYPQFCPTPDMDADFISGVMSIYEDGRNKEIMKAATEVEYEFYCQHTRVEEMMDFARKMNYKKIGIATCVGLLKESGMLAKILRHNGFEVFGIGCKAGAQKKSEMGVVLPEDCTLSKNMCNPILQATILNKEKTDFNIVMGLCVGHDSLFYKYSEAPVSTLVVKDRVLGNNPCVALYSAEGYMKNRFFK